MSWESVNIMFPHGGTQSDIGYLTTEQIRINDLEKVELTLNTPTRRMIANTEKLIWYPNGDMDRFYIYNPYPEKSINGKYGFNIYAQKAYNKWVEENLND